MRKEYLTIVITCFLLNIWIFPVQDLSYAQDLKVIRSKPAKTLQYFVNKRRLPDGIKRQIEERGKADVIVTLDGSDAQEKARQMRKSLGLRIDNATIIDEKARIYNTKKNKVLSQIPTSDYTLLKDYNKLSVIYIEVNENALMKLLESPDVKFIGENNKSVPALAQSLGVVNAQAANDAGAMGTNNWVAVLDTGVEYGRDAFRDSSGNNCTSPGSPSGCKVAYAHDFTPSDDDQRDDSTKHGTLVSGIIVGVAPDTKILGLDVYRYDGQNADDSDVLDALGWVLSNISNYHIKVVNISFSTENQKHTSPCPSDNYASAISDLKFAGVLTVASSGNDGFKDGISRPACIPDVISVGAVYDQIFGNVDWGICNDVCIPGLLCYTGSNQVACASNSASFLTMLAPGSIIDAAGESNKSGTSLAAAHVAGAIAAIGDATGLHPENIRKVLTTSGVSVTDRFNSIAKRRLEVGPISCSNPVRILGGSNYSSLQAAYNDTGVNGNGYTIQATKSIIIGNLTATGSKTVTLVGGYDCDFGTRTGYTYVKGNIRSDQGSVEMGRVVLMR